MKRLLKMRQKRQGFTIIEISIVMVFVSALLISIALVISNIMSVYQKGLTLKSVDSVGRNLVEEFTTTINSAPSIDTANLCRTHYGGTPTEDICQQDNAYKFVFQSHQPADKAIQYSGALCTGNYSYIWNTKYGIDAHRSLNLKYRDASGTTRTIIQPHLVRFEDRNYRACTASMVSSTSYEINNNPDFTIDITNLENGQPNSIPDPEQNFLDGSEIPLLLYELTIFPISQDSVTLRSFFSGTFILATEQGEGGIDITRTDDYCEIENAEANTLDIGSQLNYCAINKFNFAARTAGV